MEDDDETVRSFILPPPPEQPPPVVVVNKRTLDDAVNETTAAISLDHYASQAVSPKDRLEFYAHIALHCAEMMRALEDEIDEAQEEQ